MKMPIANYMNDKILTRILSLKLESFEVFSHQGFSWGGGDKLYQYHDSKIDVVRYTPDGTEGSTNWFEPIGEIIVESWKGDVIGAKVAPFGTGVECENALLIAKSEGTIKTLPGEPVNWHIFPRSKHHGNQLHVVYDDRLDIWSFNQDLFVDQDTKLAGFRVD
jgi:hypothetical protein